MLLFLCYFIFRIGSKNASDQFTYKTYEMHGNVGQRFISGKVRLRAQVNFVAQFVISPNLHKKRWKIGGKCSIFCSISFKVILQYAFKHLFNTFFAKYSKMMWVRAEVNFPRAETGWKKVISKITLFLYFILCIISYSID